MTRPCFVEAGASLYVTHPCSGELLHVQKQDTPRTIARARLAHHTPHPELLCLCIDDDIELWDARTLKRAQRLQKRGGGEGLCVSGKYIYQTHTDPHRLLSFDLHTQQCTSRAHRGESYQDACISPDGAWLLIASQDADLTSSIALYDLSRPLYPALHLSQLDLRGLRSPICSRAKSSLSVCFDHVESRFFVLCSRLGNESATWPGWRGTIACFDVLSGRYVWHAELDAELTGDWRGACDLDRKTPISPAMTCSGSSLWIGGWDSSVMELDARDGAFRRASYHAGAHACIAMHCGEHGLTLMNERGMISTLEVS